jgi:molecular chaperone HscB
MNAFTLFGLEPSFSVDTTDLQKRYRELQAKNHPDRFVNASDAHKREAMELTTQINEAYTALKDPVPRAMHLLSLHGIDALDANDTSMPHDFLIEQIEWRESIADAKLKEDTDRLDAMGIELNGVLESLGTTFSYAYEGAHMGVATTLVRKMRFTQKLIEEVDSAIADLEQ